MKNPHLRKEALVNFENSRFFFAGRFFLNLLPRPSPGRNAVRTRISTVCALMGTDYRDNKNMSGEGADSLEIPGVAYIFSIRKICPIRKIFSKINFLYDKIIFFAQFFSDMI